MGAAFDHADMAKDPLPITGKLARLRRLRPTDAGPFHAYRSDPDVACFQGWEAMDLDRCRGFTAAMETAPLF